MLQYDLKAGGLDEMKLFDEMPYLENERLILREMTPEDAFCLGKISKDPKVYIYLPAFLYEHRYDDPLTVINRMYEECFLTKESILLGVFLKENPDIMVGIAEIYAYDEAKNKASIGYRLAREYWHQGIASETGALLKDYLDRIIETRTITAHVMTHNGASAAILKKLGFENRFPLLWEDWGREGPVLTDKYVYKNSEHKKG